MNSEKSARIANAYSVKVAFTSNSIPTWSDVRLMKLMIDSERFLKKAHNNG